MDNNKIVGENIIQNEIYSEMKESYLDYAMSVIVGRALPDVRDGLKPVHRRILYGMHNLGITPDKPHKKSARTVGEVMAKYHPHGDSSIYDAMVRMAQDFSIRYMLVDGHGNFGSIEGDGAAAMRYTEARMSHLALQMLRDIDKKTVDFVPNFDDEEEEPSVLPSRFPQLLVNGSNGIAVGMATSIPPHNLGEVIDATVKLIDDRETSDEELAKIIKGPDFPTGAKILGRAGIREGYLTGQGKIKIRSTIDIEQTKKGKEQLVVSEIPYQVNKTRLMEKIGELVKEKIIEGISEIRDETNKEGIRIVIELKRDANASIVLNKLYKHTSLQESMSMIMIALVNGEPKKLTLLQILNEYIKHQKEIVTRRTQFDLEKAENRAHILEGLRIALDNIDEIIKIIRSSYDDAKQKLMDTFSLSEVQTQAILDMKLARLQGLEREKIENEYSELQKKISYYKEILSNEGLLMNVIKEELLEIKEKYADERRTQIVDDDTDIEEEDLIERKNVTITLTHKGYAKRMDVDEYKTQKRGGKGITGLKTRENDFVKNIINTSTHDDLLFFTNYGKAHKIKAYQIPEATRTAKGIPIINFVNLDKTEEITAVIPIDEFREDKYLIAVTSQGLIKKVKLSEFESNRKSGLIAVKLHDGDKLIAIEKTNGDDDVLIVTRKGMSIRFNENDVRATGRQSIGVKAITLKGDDEIISMQLVSKGKELLVVSKKGYGKRTGTDKYTLQTRGGKGNKTYDNKKFDVTGELTGALIVDEEDDIMLINSDGIVIRIKAKEIPNLSRATKGVRIMKVGEDANIISLAKVMNEEDSEQLTL